MTFGGYSLVALNRREQIVPTHATEFESSRCGEGIMSNPHHFAIPGLGAFGKPASGLNNRGGPERRGRLLFWVTHLEAGNRSLRPSFRRMLVATGRLTRTKVERPASGVSAPRIKHSGMTSQTFIRRSKRSLLGAVEKAFVKGATPLSPLVRGAFLPPPRRGASPLPP